MNTSLKGLDWVRKKTKNPRHIELARILRQARKDKGSTQQEIADHLGLSRETVVAIENLHCSTLESLEVDVVHNWWHHCKGKATAMTLLRMKQYWIRHFI